MISYTEVASHSRLEVRGLKLENAGLGVSELTYLCIGLRAPLHFDC